MVLEIPGSFVGIGHSYHGGGSPGNRKQSRERNKEGETLPAGRQNIFNKAYRGVATAHEKQGLYAITHDAKHHHIK